MLFLNLNLVLIAVACLACEKPHDPNDLPGIRAGGQYMRKIEKVGKIKKLESIGSVPAV